MFGICLDAGINFFDNAEGYERGKSEIVMGKALKALDASRDSYCISSKVFLDLKIILHPLKWVSAENI